MTLGVLVHDFHLGGAERVAIRLANAWHRMGCRVIVYCGNPVGTQRGLLDSAIEVVVASPPIRSESLAAGLVLGRWLGAELGAHSVDAVYLPGNTYFPSVNRLAAVGVPAYVTISNLLRRPDRSRMRNAFFAWLTRRRLRGARGIASMSRSLHREDVRIHGREAASTVLPNALFDGPPAVSGVVRRRWHLCAVGRLVPQKNFSLLLRSLALLQDLPVTLSIAGDGPQRGELQQLAAALGISDRVNFLGAVADAARCIAEAEVLLLTSDYEGYPAVAVEAVTVGTYVIASDCSVAIGDIIDSIDVGTIVVEQRAQAFAMALRRYFEGADSLNPVARRAAAARLLRTHDSTHAAREYLRFMGVPQASPVAGELPAGAWAPGRAQ